MKRKVPPERSERAWPWLAAGPAVTAALAAYFLVLSRHAWAGFPLDDAWIHRVYAKAMAGGGFFAYNADGVQVTGVTSPLWAVVSAPAHWLELFGAGVPIVAVKMLGVGAACVAAWAVGRIAVALGASMWIAAVASVLFALSPRLSFSALSGMEDVLLAALWIVGAERSITGNWKTAAALFGLAAVARPEAAVLLCLFPLAVWCCAEQPKTVLVRPATWVGLFAPLALWVLFCLLVSGRPLPTTFYVKAGGLNVSAAAIGALFEVVTTSSLAGLWVYPIGLGAFAWLSRRSDKARPWRAAALLLAGAPLLYLLGVTSTRSLRPDGYYWLRYTDAALLALHVPFVVGIALSLGRTVAPRPAPPKRRGAAPERSPRWPAALGVAIALCMLLNLPGLASRITERRERLTSDSRVIDRMNVAGGQWVAEHTPLNARVAVNDAGAIRYFGNRHTLDIVGLNDAEIAFKRLSPAERAQRLGVGYLIGFPKDLNAALLPLLPHFRVVKTLSVPYSEYTICRCRGQTIQLVLARK